jgi:predicted cupin superfamily sugar epimerase
MLNCSNRPSVRDIIEKYNLIHHPEGGYFREDFKSEIELPDHITKRGSRSLITTCYYLIPKGERSIFHKLTSVEIWNFLCGDPVDFYEIDAEGHLTHSVLGTNINAGQELKHLVKPHTWFGVLPQDGTEYAFFSAIVFPGFEFEDWEPGNRTYLKKLCPQASFLIDRLTPELYEK